MIPDTNIKKIRTIRTPTESLLIKYNNSKKIIISANMDGSITTYNSKTLHQENILLDSETKSINNACTGFDVDYKNSAILTATYSGGLIKIWDHPHQKCCHTIREKRQVNGIIYHPKSPKFFTYGDDGNIHLYDNETGVKEYVYSKSQRYCLDGHVSKVFTLKFNPTNSNEFLTGGWDRTVYIWDTRCQNAIKHLSEVFICGDGIAISSSGKEVFTTEWVRDNAIKHWDLRAAKMIEIIKPDPDGSHLYCGMFLSNYSFATGGSEDNMFRIINLESKTTISTIKGLSHGVYSIDICNYTNQNMFSKYENFGDVPIVLFSSGPNIYEIRYRK